MRTGFDTDFLKNAPPLSIKFYQQSASIVAPALLGKIFVRKIGSIWCAAKITETEAYLGVNDLASHSSRGMTVRNASMFLAGGHSYVYMIYGLHYCFNVVTGKVNQGEAVLIRSADVLAGRETLMQNRAIYDEEKLLTGPGNFAKAFAITKEEDGVCLQKLIFKFIAVDSQSAKFKLTKRIGITRDAQLKLRFVMAQN